jgi:hypothetical protein
MSTPLPTNVLNAELSKLGRNLGEAVTIAAEWQEGLFGLRAVWSDGTTSWLNAGAEATAVMLAAQAIHHASRP